MTEDTNGAAPDEETLIRVQHAVVIQNAADIRALNDLLSVGWRAVSSSPMDAGVLVILERAGSQSDVEEMREALGYNALADPKAAASPTASLGVLGSGFAAALGSTLESACQGVGAAAPLISALGSACLGARGCGCRGTALECPCLGVLLSSCQPLNCQPLISPLNKTKTSRFC